TSLSFDAAACATSLTQSAGNNLTVYGNVSINHPSASAITAWNINANIATVTGNVSFVGTNTSTGRVGKIVLTTGTLSIGGDLVYGGAVNATAVIDLSGGVATLNVGGSMTLSTGFGTLTPGTTSTVNYTGTGTYNVG